MSLLGDYLSNFTPQKWFDKGMDWLGIGNEDQVEAANETLNQNAELWKQNQQQNQSYLDQYLQKVQGMDNPTQQYQQALEDYKNIGTYDPQSFSYNGKVEDFVGPGMEMRQKNAMNAITQSQANAGNMFSSDYLNALNAKAQAIAGEEMDKAYDRMAQDRQMALNEFNANAGQQQAAYNSKNTLYGNLLNQLGQNYNQYNQNQYNALGDYYTGIINNNNAYTQGLTNLNESVANNNLGQVGGVAALLGTLGGAVGNIFR